MLEFKLQNTVTLFKQSNNSYLKNIECLEFTTETYNNTHTHTHTRTQTHMHTHTPPTHTTP